MKIFELVGAYWRLLFPSLPKGGHAMESSCVVSFVKEHARGNISLQSGKYLTQRRHEEMVEDLKGYRFSA